MTNLTKHVYFAAGLTAAGLLLAGSSARAQQTVTADTNAKPVSESIKLQMDPSALKPDPASKIRIGYMPVAIQMTENRPAMIKKEPAYLSKPRYGVIHVGNGPASEYDMAFDEPADGEWKVYVDVNRNGDLTDDGDGKWVKKQGTPARTVYGTNDYVLRASWGTPTHETGHSPYGIALYRIATQQQSHTAFMYREAARVGEATIDGKTHKIMLVENDADALYNKPVNTGSDGHPLSKVTGRPVWLLVDMKDDGKFSLAADSMFDVRAPFKIGNRVYEAEISDDGYRFKLESTTKAEAQLTPKAKPLLAVGTTVPDFQAEGWGGAPVHPADFRGKVLILDFWATWCAPCQKSMPHIERVYKAVKDKNVAVLAVCVWDEKDAYMKWVPKNQDKYSFPLAFDKAGKDYDNSIAKKLFNVGGIPTTYIIGPDGKIADSIVGYDNNDVRVEAALKKLGVVIDDAATK